MAHTSSDFAPSHPESCARPIHLVAAVSRLGNGNYFDDFQILGLLGEGTFGKVFLARQVSLDRHVALKVTANWGSEARTMARLEHSHIVPVYSEFIDHQNDLRVLCMQFVPGATLRDVIRQMRALGSAVGSGQAILNILDQSSCQPAKLDPSSLRAREILAGCPLDEAVCWIGQQLAEALAHAHHQGVLHLDIKPANILLNQYSQPMLSDFSVSLRTSESAVANEAVIGGTRGYMSPEQVAHRLAGDSSTPIDGRSDIYSFGLVLFELLTCQSWDSESNTGTTGQIAKCTATSHEPSEILRDRNWITIPRVLARVLCRCLQHEPARRIPTATQLAESLAGCRELLRVQRNLPAGGQLTRWAAGHPLWFILLFTIVPNVMASALNTVYLAQFVVQNESRAQQSAFGWMVLWYNLIIVVTMSLLVDRTLLAAFRRFRKLESFDGPQTLDDRQVRQRALMLPAWGVILSCIGWLPFAPTIPLGMQLQVGSIERGILWHVFAAYVLTSLIALVCNYYVISFVVLRVLYMRLWSDAQQFRQTAADELASIPRRNRIFQFLAGLTPLAGAVLLVAVGPTQFTVEGFNHFRALLAVLIGAGVAGFWLATTGTNMLNECIVVFTQRNSATCS